MFKSGLFLLCIFFWGCAVGSFLFPSVKTITTVVNEPATDEQLINFWFGDSDKSALRKRICK